jgi:uncharacterized delta-60 repeat protein
MRRLAVLVCVALCAMAAPAAAATAPARVAYAISPPGYSAGFSDPATPNLALPDAGVLTLLADNSGATTRALALRRDGSLDPAFGRGGVVALPSVGIGLQIAQAERLADGRLLLAGAARDSGTFSPLRLVLLRLLPSGAPDPSFGTGGVVVITTISPQAGAAPVAVASDGSIVVTGSRLKPGEPNPLNPATTDWVVARLQPDGTPDASFGVITIPVGAGRRAEGTSAATAPDGSMVVVGHANAAPGSFRQTFAIIGLTASGAPDAAFNGGAPALVPLEDVRRLERRPGGALDLVGTQGVARFTAAGALDTTFATAGKLSFITGSVLDYLPTPDGGALMQDAPAASAPTDIDRRIAVRRVTAAGALGGSTTLFTPFGGGFARPDNRTLIDVRQNAFSGRLLRRDDGSLLLIGGLRVYVPTGKMDSISVPFLAAQAFTPELVPDRSFGGPAQPARLTVQIRRQRARTDAAKRRVVLRLTASQAGLVALRVRDARKRVLASGTHPVYAAGTKIVSVGLTSLGRRVLGRARHGLRISVRHDYRDIFAAEATGVTQGRLG